VEIIEKITRYNKPLKEEGFLFVPRGLPKRGFFDIVSSMTVAKILEGCRSQKIGGKPVVILPLEIWKRIEDKLEDSEIFGFENIRRKIARARKETRLYSVSEVKKALRI